MGVGGREMTMQDEAWVRARIDAAGLRLPDARAAEIVGAASLVQAMVARVRGTYAHTDEPAAVAKLQDVRK